MTTYDDDSSAGAVGGRVMNACVKRLTEALAPLDIRIDIPRGLLPRERFQECMDQIIASIESKSDTEIETTAQGADTLHDLTPRQILEAMRVVVAGFRDSSPSDKVVVHVWDFLVMVMRELKPLTIVQKKVTEGNFQYMERYIEDLLEADEGISRFGNGRYRHTAKLAIYP